MSVRRAYTYWRGILVLVPRLSIVIVERKTRAHSYAPTQPCERTMRVLRQPSTKGCASAGVARFYLRHSSAKGVRDREILPTYLRGGAVFVFFSKLRTRTHVCVYVRAQWRFSVPRPFKQAEEILRRTSRPRKRSPLRRCDNVGELRPNPTYPPYLFLLSPFFFSSLPRLPVPSSINRPFQFCRRHSPYRAQISPERIND